ncbi:MAG: Crp/Fnr family transcriptional regulator [Rickettsiales bacterium]|nr:Crp/Fnr family transcriptional regulator [Rickettsiales bacterium]
MPQETGNIHNWLKSLSLFAMLADDDIATLLRQSQLKELAKGDMLFLQGEPARNFYIVISGWIKLFRETGDGHESIAGLCSEGDTFGDAVLYKGAHYPFSAQAVEPSKVLCIPEASVKELIEQRDSTFAAHIIQAMSQRMHTLELQVEHLSVMTAPQRIGCFLLKLCRRKAEHNVELILPYDKGLVAMLLGMKLETFSRALHQLKPVGVEVKGAMVTVADIHKLQEYVCVSCSQVAEECAKEIGRS